MFTNNMLRSSIHRSVINGLQNDPDYLQMKENSKLNISKSRQIFSEFRTEHSPEYELIRITDSTKNIGRSVSMQSFQSLKTETNSTDSVRTVRSNDQYDESESFDINTKSRRGSFSAIDVVRGNLEKTQSSRDLCNTSRRNSCSGQF